MHQIVAQILLGERNIDQAAERLKVNRQLVQHWVERIEEEVDSIKQSVSTEAGQPPPPTKLIIQRNQSKSEPQVDELRTKVLAFEEQLEVLYYFILVRVAKYELNFARLVK